jgi:hypothetical protein
MRTLALMLCLLPLIAACGGADPDPDGPDPSVGPPPGMERPADVLDPEPEPEVPPPPPPEPQQFLDVKTPEGWSTLSGVARDELFDVLSDPPSGLEQVHAISLTASPGATAPDERWEAWKTEATGAVLYRVPEPEGTASATAADWAVRLTGTHDETDLHDEGEFAWTTGGEGNVVLAAFQNELGMYLVVGVVRHPDRTYEDAAVIVDWARGIGIRQD